MRAIRSAIARGLEGLSLISPGVKVGGPVVYRIPSGLGLLKGKRAARSCGVVVIV